MLDKVKVGRNCPACFYCGEEITKGSHYLVWLGAGSVEAIVDCAYGAGKSIELHPECCLQLIIRLMRDIHEYELKDGGCEPKFRPWPAGPHI